MHNEKRPYKKLTEDEKAALRQLHDAEGVTSSGPCDLARSLTGDHRIKPSDPQSLTYVGLIREGWIVIRHADHSKNICRYGVSDDYLALQPA